MERSNLFVDVIGEDENSMTFMLADVEIVEPLCVARISINDIEFEVEEIGKITYDKFDSKVFYGLGKEMNPLNLVSGIEGWKNKQPDSKYFELTNRLYDAYLIAKEKGELK